MLWVHTSTSGGGEELIGEPEMSLQFCEPCSAIRKANEISTFLKGGMLTHLLSASLQTPYSRSFLLFERALGPLHLCLQVPEHITPIFTALLHKPCVPLSSRAAAASPAWSLCSPYDPQQGLLCSQCHHFKEDEHSSCKAGTTGVSQTHSQRSLSNLRVKHHVRLSESHFQWCL